MDKTTPHICLDGAALPHVVSEHIASFLAGTDLINLGRTSRFWNDVSKKNRVWKTIVENRFGKKACQNRNQCSPIEYKKLYFELGTRKKPAITFDVSWLNGDYLDRVRDSDSKYGEVIQLNYVCFLQINQYFCCVGPGKYTLKWRMKLDGVFINKTPCQHLDGIEFCAKPAEGCGTEMCSKWKDADLKRAERRHGNCKWFIQNMGEFEVTSTCKVYVEIKGRNSGWCGGIAWDYAQLSLH